MSIAVAVVIVAGSLLVPTPKWWARLVRPGAFWRGMGVRRRLDQRRPLILFYAGLALVAAILLVVWVLPSLLTRHPHIDTAADRHRAVTDTRTVLVAMLAVVGAAGGIAYTARTYRLSREGHITDRYSKAIEQLGSDKIEVRLGGIYALERLMRDSPSDQPTIMEVLAAYVRHHTMKDKPINRAARDRKVAGHRHPGRGSTVNSPTEDVQAALTVLGRRHSVDGEMPIDLHNADLTGAELSKADLVGAQLGGADLTGAWLVQANLIGTWLGRADLTGAQLSGADLTDAGLYEANLTGAQLSGANLTDAGLGGASLTGAQLTGANLTGARVTLGTLSQEQLGTARHTDTIQPLGQVGQRKTRPSQS